MTTIRRRMLTTITTAREAIEVLGGVKVVASWLRTSTDNVMMMRHRGHIARGFHLHFYLTLKARGLQMEPRLFDLPTFDQLIMPRLRARKTTNLKRAA